jgi:hypothetical protein
MKHYHVTVRRVTINSMGRQGAIDMKVVRGGKEFRGADTYSADLDDDRHAGVMLGGVVASPVLAQSLCDWEYWDEGWWALVCYSPDLDSWWIADWWKAW